MLAAQMHSDGSQAGALRYGRLGNLRYFAAAGRWRALRHCQSLVGDAKRRAVPALIFAWFTKHHRKESPKRITEKR